MSTALFSSIEGFSDMSFDLAFSVSCDDTNVELCEIGGSIDVVLSFTESLVDLSEDFKDDALFFAELSPALPDVMVIFSEFSVLP